MTCIRLLLAEVILTDVDCRLKFKGGSVSWFKDAGHICTQSTQALFTRNRYNSRSVVFFFGINFTNGMNQWECKHADCSIGLRSCKLFCNDTAKFLNAKSDHLRDQLAFWKMYKFLIFLTSYELSPLSGWRRHRTISVFVFFFLFQLRDCEESGV
jgi:hypothetical protein